MASTCLLYAGRQGEQHKVILLSKSQGFAEKHMEILVFKDEDNKRT